MMGQISVKELEEYFVDTLSNCGRHILYQEDEVIETSIFEDFDTDVVAFLHQDSLNRLLNAHLISQEIADLCSELRDKVFKLEEQDKWDMNSVKHDSEWKVVMELCDKIRGLKTSFDAHENLP